MDQAPSIGPVPTAYKRCGRCTSGVAAAIPRSIVNRPGDVAQSGLTRARTQQEDRPMSDKWPDTVSRREFLKNGTAAGVGATAVTGLGA